MQQAKGKLQATKSKLQATTPHLPAFFAYSRDPILVTVRVAGWQHACSGALAPCRAMVYLSSWMKLPRAVPFGRHLPILFGCSPSESSASDSPPRPPRPLPLPLPLPRPLAMIGLYRCCNLSSPLSQPQACLVSV